MAKTIKPLADAPNTEPASQMSDAGEPLSAAAEAESGFLGSMREDAELLDAIVEDAMRRRQLQAWRPRSEDFAALEAMAEETGQSLNELLDQALHLLLERQSRQRPSIDEDSGHGYV